MYPYHVTALLARHASPPRSPQMKHNPYNVDLDQNPANHVALSPLSYLERSAWEIGRAHV